MSTATILEQIVAQRREDVATAKAAMPIDDLRAKAASAPPAIDFVARLRQDAPVGLIAEIKRASPSKGDIALDIDAAEQAATYARGGAAGISVLTEPTWFKGSLDDMLAARKAIDGASANRPGVLRKDFVVDEYQVVEARAYGADAVLLIVACLDDPELAALLASVQAEGMEALVEVANADEMARAKAIGARFIGINNRNLHDFTVDMGTTDRLASLAPQGALLAALSGINERTDVERFQQAGAEAVLVGESLMRAPDAAAKIAELAGR